MARLFRFWMTGSIAVLAAALGGGKSAAAEERQPLLRTSRYGVAETIERLEARAHEHGLNVFARMPSIWRGQSDDTTIVFESERGGTPVVMETPDSLPNLPLAISVHRNDAGDVEVVLQLIDWEGLPPEVARDMTRLPALVEAALS